MPRALFFPSAATRADSSPKGGGSAVSGIEWDGNQEPISGSTYRRRMLYWATPFAAYGSALNAGGTAGGAGATIVMKVFPKGPKTGTAQPYYWTNFFHGNNGVFGWGGGAESSYYGMHPYPFTTAGGFPFNGQSWEVSADFNDYPPGAPWNDDIANIGGWNRWYTQVTRVWQPTAGSRVHEFYWDWPDVSKVIVRNSGTGYVAPPSPIFCVGQAPDPWGGNAGYEEYKGIIRGIQIYSLLLGTSDITTELTTPQGSSNGAAGIWYLNLNPTVADPGDKKSGGTPHDPTWDGPLADRPTTWTG